MKVLIIEDEKPAADRLQKLLKEADPQIQILSVLVSVRTSVQWFKENTAPDLVFMDINLSDGESFEIFRQTEISSPVVFTTAYDQYALEAFTVNSIDYLLKPVKREDIIRALDKFKKRNIVIPEKLQELMRNMGNPVAGKNFQKRIIIRYGDTIKMIEIPDVAYFYTEEKINFLCTKDNLRYPIDQNLDELESILDPAVFFRINRQFIVNIHAIEKMLAWSKSRVKIILKPASTHETIVSTERSPHFKEWLTGN